MGALAMMRSWFSGPAERRPRRRGGPPEMVASESGMRSLAQASKANDRAAMGLVLTSGKAMSAETRIQAAMAGMLREMDRAHDAVD